MKTGVLYIVATPIGNLADISERALEVLRSVDRIAAEDTRHSQRLLGHYQIETKCLSLNAHNEVERAGRVIQWLSEGLNIALISDAGTPLISDPGYRLVEAVTRAGIQVIPIPGASAVVAALSASGLPADRFVFDGFLPVKSGPRQKALCRFKDEARTVVFYEAPHRVLETLRDMQDIFSEEREVVIAKEITKKFEAIVRSPIKQAIKWLTDEKERQQGEFVLLLSPVKIDQNEALKPDTRRIATLLKAEFPVKKAAQLTAEITGERKNKIYDWLLTQ